jgi:serine/threonine protein kinase
MDSAEWQKIKIIFNAVIDLPENEQMPFLENYDPETLREVEKLLKAHKTAAGFIVESAFVDVGLVDENQPDPYLGKQIDDYRILKEIGQGGMGTVYLAVRADETFDKKVAIKLIKRGMDTTAVLKRFMMERKILAQLENPNIAALIDGGSTSDGLPYLVMEYIEGLPVTKFCDLHNFSIEERLELFRKICSAISYAHQNLVVHRDIKPSNILVTADGTPKLLDFGIAKLLHPDLSLETNEATATMFRVMTPEYASPEQIRGLPIMTASDVYSLGVVLYELLSGERPFKIESRLPAEVAQIILTEEPVRPSSVISSKFRVAPFSSEGETVTNDGKPTLGITQNQKPKIQNLKSLRGDLDNIILKALRKEPERRYQSVQEFSDDIRRHLTGLPVSATADTRRYRLGKFINRHRTGVLVGLLMLVTILTATGITTWQAIIAKREQAKTQLRFNQVRKLANTILFEYHDGIAKLPGSTSIREKMVIDALEYLDNLSTESSGDIELQRELAAAYNKIGDVQGDPFSANLGNSKGALESYKKALSIRQTLNFAAPENEPLKLDLIHSLEAVGGMSQAVGDTPAALENYRQAFLVFDSLSSETAESKLELSILQRRYAKALAVSGKLAESLENYQKAITILNGLMALNPNEIDYQRELGLTKTNFGDALVESGNLNDALAADRSAYALLKPLVIPTDAQSLRLANTAYTRISKVLALTGDHQGSLEIELNALKVDQDLAKADPSNAIARRDVYVDYLKIARQQSALGDFKQALVNQHRFLELCEAEIALNPNSAEMQNDLAVGYLRFGEIQEKSGDLPAALVSYKKMLSLQETISQKDPANARQRGNLAEILTKVSDTALKLGDKINILEGYQKALGIQEELIAANPANDDQRVMLANTYNGLGDYYAALATGKKRGEDWRKAKNWYQKSLDVWNELKDRGKYQEAELPVNLVKKIAKCDFSLAQK